MGGGRGRSCCFRCWTRCFATRCAILFPRGSLSLSLPSIASQLLCACFQDLCSLAGLLQVSAQELSPFARLSAVRTLVMASATALYTGRQGHFALSLLRQSRVFASLAIAALQKAGAPAEPRARRMEVELGGYLHLLRDLAPPPSPRPRAPAVTGRGALSFCNSGARPSAASSQHQRAGFEGRTLEEAVEEAAVGGSISDFIARHQLLDAPGDGNSARGFSRLQVRRITARTRGQRRRAGKRRVGR